MDEGEPTGEAEGSVELVKVRRAVCKNSLFLNIHACRGEDLKIVLEKSYFSKSEVFSLALHYSTPGRPEENGFETTPGERGGDRGRRGRGRGKSFV